MDNPVYNWLYIYTLRNTGHECIIMHMPRIVDPEVNEARDLIESADYSLALTREDVDLWFAAYSMPSPTRFALDFGIRPSELRATAESSELVELALYRIIAVAESRLYTHVYGPKSVIQRVELFLPVSTVEEEDLQGEYV